MPPAAPSRRITDKTTGQGWRRKGGIPPIAISAIMARWGSRPTTAPPRKATVTVRPRFQPSVAPPISPPSIEPAPIDWPTTMAP